VRASERPGAGIGLVDDDTVPNELFEEGNRRILERHDVNLARERLGERCGKLEDIGTDRVHGDVHVGAGARGSPCLRAEEHGYAHVLAAGEDLAQAGDDLLGWHRPSLPRVQGPVTVPRWRDVDRASQDIPGRDGAVRLVPTGSLT
jgi:hypothetical protein